MIYPPFLHEGDLVRIVSPSGAIDPELVSGAEECLSSWGFRVVRGACSTNRAGRFAGSQTQRLEDLQQAFDDPACKAVFCSRGGYGAVHLIDKLNLESFRKHPKWLVGYSDITMLHSLLQREGYASVHGGMAKLLAGQMNLAGVGTGLEPAELLQEILLGRFPDYFAEGNALNRHGSACGTLRGGNLSILYSLRGTPFDYLPEGSILFIEDTGEQPYVVDRIMHNLKLGGILKNISGLIVGQFTDYEEDPGFGKTVYEIIADSVSKYAFPVCFNFPSGHVERNLPLVTGGLVKLEVSENGTRLTYL